MKTMSHRTLAAGLGVMTLVLTASAVGAQGWRGPVGSARAAWVSGGAGAGEYASAALPAGGGISKADNDVVSAGVLTARAATAVTSGSESIDRFGVQSVATASDVSILSGRIRATRVIAIATMAEQGNKTMTDGDGSTLTGLVVDGVSFADGAVAPNTRVNLPGAGYVMLNEQVKGKGRAAVLTVNMIHVFLVDSATGATTEVIVGSAKSGNGS